MSCGFPAHSRSSKASTLVSTTLKNQRNSKSPLSTQVAASKARETSVASTKAFGSTYIRSYSKLRDNHTTTTAGGENNLISASRRVAISRLPFASFRVRRRVSRRRRTDTLSHAGASRRRWASTRRPEAPSEPAARHARGFSSSVFLRKEPHVETAKKPPPTHDQFVCKVSKNTSSVAPLFLRVQGGEAATSFPQYDSHNAVPLASRRALPNFSLHFCSRTALRSATQPEARAPYATHARSLFPRYERRVSPRYDQRVSLQGDTRERRARRGALAPQRPSATSKSLISVSKVPTTSFASKKSRRSTCSFFEFFSSHF